MYCRRSLSGSVYCVVDATGLSVGLCVKSMWWRLRRSLLATMLVRRRSLHRHPANYGSNTAAAAAAAAAAARNRHVTLPVHTDSP